MHNIDRLVHLVGHLDADEELGAIHKDGHVARHRLTVHEHFVVPPEGIDHLDEIDDGDDPNDELLEATELGIAVVVLHDVH